MRLPARSVLSLLRHGGDHADRHRQLFRPTARHSHLRRQGGSTSSRSCRCRPMQSRLAGAGRLRASPARRRSAHRRSRDATSGCPPIASAKSGSTAPASPRATGTSRRRRQPTLQVPICASGRRAVPPHRRSWVLRRRRIVRHRPAQGPDHRPRREPLSAGHRDDGGEGQPAGSAECRRRPLPSICKAASG